MSEWFFACLCGMVLGIVIGFILAVNALVSTKATEQDEAEMGWIARDGQSQVDQWLKKGRQVYLEGTPSLSMYTDSQGHPSCNFKLAVHRIELLGGREENQLQEAGTPQGKLFKVVIEAGWLIEGNWHVKVNKYMTPNKAAAMGRSVGRNHQTGILMHELCKRYMIPVELQRPLKKCWEGKDGKITQREIEQVTEHPKLPRMNQDQRDALLIAWVHSQLPMRAVTVQAKNNAGTLKRQR